MSLDKKEYPAPPKNAGDQPGLNIRAKNTAQHRNQPNLDYPTPSLLFVIPFSLTHTPLPEPHCRPMSHKRHHRPRRDRRRSHVTSTLMRHARDVSLLPRVTGSEVLLLPWAPPSLPSCPCPQPYGSLFLSSIASVSFLIPQSRRNHLLLCGGGSAAGQDARKPIVAPAIFRGWCRKGGCAMPSQESFRRGVAVAQDSTLSREPHRSSPLMRLWGGSLLGFLGLAGSGALPDSRTFGETF